MKLKDKLNLRFITEWLLYRKSAQHINDKVYLKLLYWAKIGKKLNLKKPQSFNEKLQWIKLYDRKPEYTKMVDKYEVKKYVADIIGEEYIIPTIGVWDSFDDIDFDSLPDKFVLKCTHDSGGLVICKDKSTLNISEAREKIEKSLSTNYFYAGREWPYKNVKPRIIAEQFLESTTDLIDYKFMCFGGKPRCCFVCTDRNEKGKAKITVYDNNWEIMELGRDAIYHQVVTKPETYDRMIEFAESLSKDIPFVRIDFYELDGRLYFGEITFFPASGLSKFTPESADDLLGSWMDLG